MTEKHQELLIELLAEKVETLKAQNEAKQAYVYHIRRCGDTTNPSEVQEIINIYEERIDELAAECDQQEREYKDIIVKLKEELNTALQSSQTSNTGKITGDVMVYKMMIKYAKKMGFKFPRLDKIKEALNEKSPKEESKSDETDKNIEIASIDDGRNVVFTPGQIVNCPHGVEKTAGKIAPVAGVYCRNKCPYYEGIDYDQHVVKCSKKLQ